MSEQIRIPFSPPDITEAEIAEVADALRSGWITTGPKTKQLERELAAFLGTPRVACLGSATAALECALRALGIGPGDEVITSAYTYTASCSPICHLGATPVLCDVAPGSYEMDYAQLGSVRHGKHAGQVADLTTFSFHAVKNFTTAEGGAVTWREGLFDADELYHDFMLMSLHGQSKDALAKTKAGAWEYDVAFPGWKCNMTDLQAGLGLAQLRRYPGMLARRRQMVARYTQNLADLDVSILQHYRAADGSDACNADDAAARADAGQESSSGHLMLVRLNGCGRQLRDRVIELMAEDGVATNVHYKPLPLLTAYRNLGFDIADFPHALAQFENEITLPLHTKLSDADIDEACRCLHQAISQAKAEGAR